MTAINAALLLSLKSIDGSSPAALTRTRDRTPTHGYEPTREAAMAAYAKSWRRE